MSSIGSNHHSKNNNRLQEKNTLQDTNQISGQSVQAKYININVTDEALLAFTTVQQMTALWCATEKQKVAVITKAVFILLQNSANNSP
jgi:hypothetical protein